MTLLKNAATVVALILAGLLVGEAQITKPHTFADGETIDAARMNANFDGVYDGALNRTGGIMTGTLTSQAIVPSSGNTYDLGTAGTRFRDLFLSGTLDTGQGANELYAMNQNVLTSSSPTFAGLTLNGAASITGALTAATLDTGQGANELYAMDQNVLTSSSPTFGGLTVNGTATATTFSGSGAGLTNIPETAITDGSIFPRLAANETITGRWIFDGTQPQQFIANEPSSLALTLRGRPSDNVASFNLTNNANSVNHLQVSASPSSVLFATGGQPFTFANGYIATNLSQPGFLCRNSAADVGQSGTVTVDCDNEIVDNASNFAADTFTAPVTGQYRFCGVVELSGLGNAEDTRLNLVTTGGTYLLDSFLSTTAQPVATLSGCVDTVPMTASSTAVLQVASTDQSYTIQTGTHFSGRLSP